MQMTPIIADIELTPFATILMIVVGVGFLLLLVYLAIAIGPRKGATTRLTVLSLTLLLVGTPLLALFGWLVAGYSFLQVEEHELPQELRSRVDVQESPTTLVSNTSMADEEYLPSLESEASPASLVYPENRPAWVVDPEPVSSTADTMTVSSDPFKYRADAIDHLTKQLTAAVSRFAASRVGDPRAGAIMETAAADWQQLVELNTSTEFPRLAAGEGSLIGNIYMERVTHPQPVGDMYRAHAQLTITQPLLQFIDTRWQAAQARERLAGVSMTVGAVVLGLLLLSAALRVGPRVVGRQRKRNIGFQPTQ